VNEFVQTWWPVVSTLAVLFVGAVTWWVKITVEKNVATMLGDISKTVQTHGERIATLEADQKLLPTKDDVHNLSLKLEGVSGDMKAMNERLDGIGDEAKATRQAIDRVQDFLLNKRP
jgi:hypothetical protein